MSDALSFAEIASQRAELLPARTVLSMFTRDTSSGSDSGLGATKLLTNLGLLPSSTAGTAGTSTGAGEPQTSSS